MRATEIIEALQSTTPEDKLLLLSLLTYEDLPITDDLTDNDVPAWKNVEDIVGTISAAPFLFNLPSGSETPIVINFTDNTIKIGSASPIPIGEDMSNYQKNPDVKFTVIIDDTNTKPIGNEGWITNQEWADDTYISLVNLTIQPDTDTGVAGGLTLDNINIIIKP